MARTHRIASSQLSAFLLFLLAAAFSSCSDARIRIPRFPGSFHRQQKIRASAHIDKSGNIYNEVAASGASARGSYAWNASYFTQNLDHFSFTQSSYATWQQKYIWWDGAWGGAESGAPIFVYCGNEGPIQWFMDNAGWIREIAVEFGALVVGPEHRYYGESMPFGSEKESFSNASTRAFLTTEQAMADMAVLLTALKDNLSAHDSPIILFGGSYGGMLAAWFRLKYPHIAAGAIAASAPILQYEDIVPSETFYRIVSHDFKIESENCFNAINSSWAEIREEAAAEGGLVRLSEQFRLCSPLTDADDLISWLETAYIYMAMVDYPVPSDFLMPLPAHPIRELCRRVDSLPASASLIDRIVAGVGVYYNYSGSESCFSVGDTDPHDMSNGWDFQNGCVGLPPSADPQGMENGCVGLPPSADPQGMENGCVGLPPSADPQGMENGCVGLPPSADPQGMENGCVGLPPSADPQGMENGCVGLPPSADPQGMENGCVGLPPSADPQGMENGCVGLPPSADPQGMENGCVGLPPSADPQGMENGCVGLPPSADPQGMENGCVGLPPSADPQGMENGCVGLPPSADPQGMENGCVGLPPSADPQGMENGCVGLPPSADPQGMENGCVGLPPSADPQGMENGCVGLPPSADPQGMENGCVGLPPSADPQGMENGCVGLPPSADPQGMENGCVGLPPSADPQGMENGCVGLPPSADPQGMENGCVGLPPSADPQVLTPKACTEHVMPMSSNASNSLFEPFEWNQTAFEENCLQQYGVAPRPTWAMTQFGGRSIRSALRHFGSNIVFSQGALDPWSGGGVLEDISDTLVSLTIPDGAHHLDLRASTPADPPSVRKQRKEEKKHIQKWIKQLHKDREEAKKQGRNGLRFSSLPSFEDVSSTSLALFILSLTLLATSVGLSFSTTRRARPIRTSYPPALHHPLIGGRQ
ncbi:unnamed protein product [Closterium sp. NIES-65]|nr:unnamed protein product [Closterium sp. NIES-65]